MDYPVLARLRRPGLNSSERAISEIWLYPRVTPWAEE
jgi:hypothetical protein